MSQKRRQATPDRPDQMSDPKRYYLYAGLECHAFSKVEAVLKFREEDDGKWVKWDDYANLKAEVERLRKAGDALAIDCAEWCMSDQCTGSGFCTLEETMENLPSIVAWNAAKQPPTGPV